MIRAYDPADRGAVLAVWEASAALAHPFWPLSRFEQERSDIEARFLPAAETYVFEQAGEVVGFIALLGNEVGGLFVTPRFHRQGIGRALMDWARRSREALELDVYQANTIGRGFYSAYGFEVVGETREEGTGETVLRMRLTWDV